MIAPQTDRLSRRTLFNMPSVFRDGESVYFCILILLIIFNSISINPFVTQTFIPFYKMIVKRNPKSDLPE